MATLNCYKKISYEECVAVIEKETPSIKQWFLNNPKRRVCRVKIFYDKTVTLRKKHIEDDLLNSVNELKLAGMLL